jgi:phage-related protein
MEMLENFGPNNVKEPYCKPLGNKLWEIRIIGRPGIAKAIYVTVRDRKIVELHAFV